MNSEAPGSGAPEGAHCAEHPERPAQFTCPRCGSFACIACWHGAVARCARCLRRDPTEAAPPIPWEAEGRSWLGRYFATLASALSPVRTAPAFARPDVRAALRFALLTAVPLALLAGIIPHTRTLMFEGNFGVRVLGHPSEVEIVLDIARAAAVQLGLSGAELLALMLPFVSLVRAYAPNRQHAAARVLLYRVWMLPGAWLLLYATFWLLPATDAASLTNGQKMLVVVMELLLTAIVPVLLFVAMGATARMSCGLGPGISIIVVAVPAVLLFLMQGLLRLGVDRLLPQLAVIPGTS